MTKLGQAYRDGVAARRAADKTAAEKDYQDLLPARTKLANTAIKGITAQLTEHFAQASVALDAGKDVTPRADFSTSIASELKLEDVRKLSEVKKIYRLCQKEDVHVSSTFGRVQGVGTFAVRVQLGAPYPKPMKPRQ